MTLIWRFFVGEDARWRWQRINIDRVVVTESRASYSDYAHCVAAAQASGYVFEAAQASLVPRKRQAPGRWQN